MLLVSDENASVVVCMRTEMGESRACMCARVRVCMDVCVRNMQAYRSYTTVQMAIASYK